MASKDPLSLRAADAERDQLAQELREHMLAGRLTAAEFEERIERTYAASTRGELEVLKDDLPMSPATLGAELARRKRVLRQRLVREASGGLSISAVCVAIWLAAGASSSFWPIWVIIFTLLPALSNALRLLGPSPDLDALEARVNRRRAREHRRRSRGHLPP